MAATTAHELEIFAKCHGKAITLKEHDLVTKSEGAIRSTFRTFQQPKTSKTVHNKTFLNIFFQRRRLASGPPAHHDSSTVPKLAARKLDSTAPELGAPKVVEGIAHGLQSSTREARDFDNVTGRHNNEARLRHIQAASGMIKLPAHRCRLPADYLWAPGELRETSCPVHASKGRSTLGARARGSSHGCPTAGSFTTLFTKDTDGAAALSTRRRRGASDVCSTAT